MLKAALTIIACSFPLAAATTSVQDTLYFADGVTKFNGSITISWGTFISSDGQQHPAGSLQTNVANGALKVSLEPNDTSSPAGTTVPISTISRTSNVVTVVCTIACGVTAGKGFYITGVTDSSFNGSGTALTGVASSTTFTFSQTASNASSSGGTVSPTITFYKAAYSLSQGQNNVTECWVVPTSGSPVGLSTVRLNPSVCGTTFPTAGTVSPSQITAGAPNTLLFTNGSSNVVWSPLSNVLPTGSQLQYFRIQPNTGNSTTFQWNPLLYASAADYNFTAIQPGGTLTASTPATVTLSLCPLGVNGTDTGHYVYVSGGTGAAETVLITGGSCAGGGTSSGTISFTPANNHSGAWTVGPASGGIAEAICALPSVGGDVWVASAITLLANVAACGKTYVNVTQFAAAISGSFTILGAFPVSTADTQRYTQSTSNSATLMSTINDPGPVNWATLGTGIRATSRSVVNNLPTSAEFLGTAAAAVVGVDGGVDGPSGTYTGGAIGIQGTARSNNFGSTGGAAAVGVVGTGNINVQATMGNSTQAWGANFITNNCAANGCTDGNGFNLNNNYGVEIDANMVKASGAVAATNILGLWVTGASTHQPSGTADAIAVGQLGVFSNISWKNGISLRDGAANVGVNIGTLATGNSQGSMPIYLNSRDAGATARTASILTDLSGNLIFRPGSGANLALEDSGANIGAQVIPNGSTPYLSVTNRLGLTQVAFASLGSVPAAGSEVYCTNCTTAATCASGGSGHAAISNGTNWTCQ